MEHGAPVRRSSGFSSGSADLRFNNCTLTFPFLRQRYQCFYMPTLNDSRNRRSSFGAFVHVDYLLYSAGNKTSSYFPG